MNKDEFAQIASAIKELYPSQKVLQTETAMLLWFSLLEDIPYRAAEAAVIKLASTKQFAPTIAEIRAEALAATSNKIKDWSEAWEEVLASIGPYGWRQTKKALETFDDLTREAVRRVGYKTICLSEHIQTERANFRMIYENLAAQKKVNDVLPPRYQALAAEGAKLLENTLPANN